MAERAASVVSIGAGRLLITWTGINTGDTGVPVKLPEYRVESAQTNGTFSSTTVSLEGTNDLDGTLTSFAVLHRADGAAPDAIMADSEPIIPLEGCVWYRISSTAGTGAGLVVRALMAKK